MDVKVEVVVEVTVGVGDMVDVDDCVKVKVGDRVIVGERVFVFVGVRQLDTVTSSMYQPRALLAELSVVTMKRSCIGDSVTADIGTCSSTHPPVEVEEEDQIVLQLL